MDLSLRRRHRITWGVLAVLLPVILIMGFAVRPEFEKKSEYALGDVCPTLLNKSDHAEYRFCNDDSELQVVLLTSFRSPSTEIHVLVNGKLTQAEEFKGERVVTFALREPGSQEMTIVLMDTVKGIVFDEFVMEI